LRQAVGCAERITFAGQLTDAQLAQVYCATDVLVLPSVATAAGVEGFGIVLLEAMAFSVPVVASATGGVPEVLDEGKCGLLVEPGSVDALAQGLLMLWRDPALASRLAHNASQRLLEHYVWRN
jgi:glycosyltransferase involved in cell wall biosynthesis